MHYNLYGYRRYYRNSGCYNTKLVLMVDVTRGATDYTTTYTATGGTTGTVAVII
ncbi:MAG: hypothetical protein ACLQQ4_04745 [Bacteroidia bacterium]